MTTEERIKDAARVVAKFKIGFDMEEEKYYQSNKVNVYDAFVAGALSPEAKEHWQQEMYTEKEVLSLLISFHPSLSTVSWFDEHKKHALKHT